MAKFSRTSKLTKNQRQELMLTLCKALISLKNEQETARFLADLLSPQEVEMIAKRLEIARLLVEGDNYETIQGKLKVSPVTIARVNTWLNISGEGFKTAIERTKRKKKGYEHSKEEVYDPFSWYNLKRRYSTYFWPQLLLEELIKQSDNKQKEKIFTILHSIENKSETLRGETEKLRKTL